MTLKLYPGDAVAALLIDEDGRYVMQQRDDKPEIFFPGCWGNFGGAIEAGETPEAALQRELEEELGVRFEIYEFFCRLVMDFSYAGAGEVVRYFFVVPLSATQRAHLTVREGQGCAAFSAGDVAKMAGIVPYDGLAIWQHAARAAIGGRYRGEAAHEGH